MNLRPARGWFRRRSWRAEVAWQSRGYTLVPVDATDSEWCVGQAALGRLMHLDGEVTAEWTAAVRADQAALAYVLAMGFDTGHERPGPTCCPGETAARRALADRSSRCADASRTAMLPLMLDSQSAIAPGRQWQDYANGAHSVLPRTHHHG
ncbi:hypothetical protein [Catenulispora pinisilvae]|uniref:hypothetical protein n=1 Tax=Catenulispora pinisilvae TaxID=2705253 RepID=UPI00189214D4|nr:hypothetical protein [Catenulispora pinisilvae]